jgi:hypothetical protein
MYKIVYQNRDLPLRPSINYATLKKEGAWSSQSLTSPLQEEKEHGSAGMGGN